MLCHGHRRDGAPCGQQAVPGSQVCRFHGGLTPAGTASPHWKNGNGSHRSKAYRSRAAILVQFGLGTAYKRAQKNPALISLREQLALCDVREEQLIRRLETGETEDAWERATKAFDDLDAATQAHDGDAMRAAAERLKKALKDGGEQKDIWDQILEVGEQRRKHAESEARTLIGMRQVLTKEQALEFAHRVALAVRQYMGVVKCVHCKEKFPPYREMGDLTRALTMMMDANANLTQGWFRKIDNGDGSDSTPA